MATIRKRRKPARLNADPTPRHLWLASLGLLVAARREGIATVECAVNRAGTAADDLRKTARKAERQVRDTVDGLRGQIEPAIARVGSEVEARLAPVLGKLGLAKPKARRPARKPRKAPAKASRRTTARKPAKRVVRKTAR